MTAARSGSVATSRLGWSISTGRHAGSPSNEKRTIV